MADFGGNMALNIEQRLGQKLTNEQLIAWTSILSRWPNCVIIPLYVSGPIATLTLGTYNANIIYLPYKFTIFGSPAAAAANPFISLYDEVNALKMTFNNVIPVWNATSAAVNYVANTCDLSLIYFSRSVFSGGSTYVSYIGYQINI